MSLGKELKALREERKLAMEELSEKTHIGIHVLEDFERDDFSHISAAVYGSGFVKIIAKFYGIDGTHLREMFATQYQSWIEAKAALPRPKKEPQKFENRRAALRQTTEEAAKKGADEAAAEKERAEKARAIREAAEARIAAREAAKEAAKIAGTAAPVAQPTPVAPVAAPVAQPTPVVPVAAPSAQPAATEYADENGLGELFEANAQAVPLVEQPPEQIEEPAEQVADDLPQRSVQLARMQIAEAFSKAAAAVGAAVASSLFQKIAATAVVFALAAWLCVLFVGGGSRPDGEEEPTGAEDVATAQAQPEAVEAVEVEDAAVEESVRIAIHGSALKDNLLPPPDRYAN